MRGATVVSMGSASVLTASLLYLPDFWMLLGGGGAGRPVRPAVPPGLGHPAVGADLRRPAGHDLRDVPVRPQRGGATAAPLLGFALYKAGGHSYDLLFWGEALIALVYAVLAYATLPARTAGRAAEAQPEERGPAGGYGAVLRDRRYLLYLLAAFFHSVVYVQYLSTLPLYVEDIGLAVFWYTVAVSLNGFIVVVFELLITKLSQNWPLKLTIGLGFALVGAGVAFYGLPLGPAALVVGTLIWSLGEIIGGPAVFAYPANA
ncbi:hypothetical protein GCM10020000_38560 [Streptomyces olivoverticillatus]